MYLIHRRSVQHDDAVAYVTRLLHVTQEAPRPRSTRDDLIRLLLIKIIVSRQCCFTLVLSEDFASFFQHLDDQHTCHNVPLCVAGVAKDSLQVLVLKHWLASYLYWLASYLYR